MEFSIVGAIVVGILLLISRRFGGIIFALIAALAFGATSFVSITALGGSSPLIYTIMQMMLIGAVVLRRSFSRDLRTVLAEQPIAWMVVIFAIYVLMGAVLLPRLFAGQTSAFIPIRPEGRIAEVPLFPTSGNITQSLYFFMNVLTFFAFSIILRHSNSLKPIRNGFFCLATLLVVFGIIDLGSKVAGIGDVLKPLRSASYAMLTSVEESGFFRITGSYAEASAYGAATVYVIAFIFTYWRATLNSFALMLSIPLLILLMLSTSSTAYVGIGLISIPLFASILKSTLRGRILKQDLFLLSCGIAMILLAIAISLYNPRVLDPFWDLLNSMVLNKASSSSAQERTYWNIRSLQSFSDTGGLGIGLGSSRAASWAVAVISQLGIIGLVLIALMTACIVNKRWLRAAAEIAPDDEPIARSLRAAILATLVTATMSAGSADPGILFFTGLAISSSLLKRSRVRQREAREYTPIGFQPSLRGI